MRTYSRPRNLAAGRSQTRRIRGSLQAFRASKHTDAACVRRPGIMTSKVSRTIACFSKKPTRRSLVDALAHPPRSPAVAMTNCFWHGRDDDIALSPLGFLRITARRPS